MNDIMSKIDTKTLQTSGAIVLALFTVYVLFKILTNDLTHLNATLEKNNEVQATLVKVIEGNTRVLESLERTVNRQ